MSAAAACIQRVVCKLGGIAAEVRGSFSFSKHTSQALERKVRKRKDSLFPFTFQL